MRMLIKRVLTFILSGLCVALLLAASLNMIIQPAQSISSDTSYLHIISGTGSFSSIQDSHTITVNPGQKISGDVTLKTYNAYPSDWVAPLIGTPSWGDRTGSWWLINGWIPTGVSTQESSVDIKAPQEPGTYYLIFAFSCEMYGNQVASSTDWHNGPVVWGDGNDLADMNSTQFAQAQQDGVVTVNWLGADGKYGATDTAADAIKVVVSGNSAIAQDSNDGQLYHDVDPGMILLVMIGITVLAFLALLVVAAVIILLLIIGRSHGKNAGAGKKVEATKKP